MNKHAKNNWFLCILLLGLSVVLLELDYVMPMPNNMHQLLLILGILLLIGAGATYLYQRARLAKEENAWWKDDDWTHWGGI